MKKSFFENLIVVSASVVITTIIGLIVGYGWERMSLMITYSAALMAVGMLIDDLVFKAEYYPHLINWQLFAGYALVLGSIGMFCWAALSETMFALWLRESICAVLGVGAFCWFYWIYRVSVMQDEERDKYEWARYKEKLAKEDAKAIARDLAKFLRFQLVNDDPQAGSDYTKPLDTEKFRTLNELKLDLRKSDKEKELITAVTNYEQVIANAIVAQRG